MREPFIPSFLVLLLSLPGAVGPAHAAPQPNDAAKARIKKARPKEEPAPEGSLKQVTGKWLRLGQDSRHMVPTADPFIRIRADGSVTVYGTGKRVLIFKSMNDFLRGGKYRVEELPFYYSDGKTMLRGQEAIWDVNKYKFTYDEKTGFFKEFPKEGSGIRSVEKQGDLITVILDNGTRVESTLEDGVLDVFYGGVINPTGGRKYARFPADNIDRRSYAFIKSRDGKLVQLPEPLFGKETMGRNEWIDHTYGRHLITDGRGNLILSKPGEFSAIGGRPVVCYEKVSRLTPGANKTFSYGREVLRQITPKKPITEPFCREMVSPFEAGPDSQEAKMFHIEERRPPPALVRGDGSTVPESSLLMEGPRVTALDNPVTGKREYFMLVSGADFSTDRYGIHVLHSASMRGPFTPTMSLDGRDLLDIAEDLRKKYKLSWGPARAHAFQDASGKWKIAFHAADKDILPGANYSTLDWSTLNQFNRNIYVADLDVSFDPKGKPHFHIVDREEVAQGLRAMKTFETIVESAPGRVNLIGDYTDVADGLVLPMAIPQRTETTFKLRPDRTVKVTTIDADGVARTFEYELGSEKDIAAKKALHGGKYEIQWTDYIEGLTDTLRAKGKKISGFEAVIRSTVPTGSGLSSSAALEVSMLKAVNRGFDLKMDPIEIAKLGRAVETDFIGAPIGVMDQTASAIADEKTAMFLDTHTMKYETVKLPDDVETVVLYVSKHSNAGAGHSPNAGSYTIRKAEIDRAQEILGKPLRELTPADLPWVERTIHEPEVMRRARHVITENQRVRDAVAAMKRGDSRELGRLFYESHESLTHDLETSTEVMDQLIGIARERGALGARMTGGGFGGSAVLLVKKGEGSRIAKQVAQDLHRATGVMPEIKVPFETVPCVKKGLYARTGS